MLTADHLLHTLANAPGPQTAAELCDVLHRGGLKVEEFQLVEQLRRLQRDGYVRLEGIRWRLLKIPPDVSLAGKPLLKVSAAPVGVVSSGASQGQQVTHVPVISPSLPGSRWALFRRLCRYYMDCLLQDEAPRLRAYLDNEDDTWIAVREDALPGIATSFALGKGRCLEIPHDGHAPKAEVLGDRAIRPPLVLQCPDLFIGGEPPCTALRRLRLCLGRRRTRGHWHGHTAIGPGDGGVAPGVAHCLERRPMGTEDLIQGFGKVLQEMEAVSHLRGLRRARAGAIHIRFQVISRDDGDPPMLAQPGRECVRLAVVEQCHRPPLFQVYHDRAVALALPVGPIIDPNGRERRDRWEGQTTHEPQQGVPTGGQSEAMRESCTRLSAEGHADRLQRGDQPMSLAGIGGDELGHTLREDAARAVQISADEFSHCKLDTDRACTSGQVRQVALIAAMD
jgi:hypothetical protein